MIPYRGPKNAPAIGAKKSKRVKETFDPASLLKGTCNATNPRRVKSAKKNNFFCMPDIGIKDNASLLKCQ